MDGKSPLVQFSTVSRGSSGSAISTSSSLPKATFSSCPTRIVRAWWAESASILGRENVNIASMHVGRRIKRGRAIVVLILDENLTPGQVTEVARAVDADFARLVRLPLARISLRPRGAPDRLRT